MQTTAQTNDSGHVADLVRVLQVVKASARERHVRQLGEKITYGGVEEFAYESVDIPIKPELWLQICAALTNAGAA